ncbi:S24/S26 family peptidase [Porphyromonas sp.]
MPSISEARTPQELQRLRSEAFFSEILSRLAEGKHPRILPRGVSMRPFIRGGVDKIVLSPLEENSFQVGRIVLAHIGGYYLVHRIVRIDGEVFTLRGDGNPYQREQCTREQILAEVKCVHRGKRVIQYGSLLWWCYDELWPDCDFLRRLCLAVYRRTLFRWGW